MRISCALVRTGDSCFHVLACVLFLFQIVDPRVPRKGFKYYGAQVKCPNDEVFKLKGKAPKNSFLVNFFDARRTWCVYCVYTYIRMVHTYLYVYTTCCQSVACT